MIEIILNIVEFVVIIIINSLLPSIILYSLFIKYFNYRFNGINLLFMLILGQMINGLFLFYLFLILPGLPSYFYSIIILFILSIIFYFQYSVIKKILNDSIILIFENKNKIKSEGFINYILKNKIFILFFLYFIFSFFLFFFRNLSNHDTIMYALIGNIITQTTKIEFSNYKFSELYGIVIGSHHGYGFSMFKVIENIFNFNNGNSDFYYRFIPIINGAYLLGIIYIYLTQKINKIVALYSASLLFFSGAFIFLLSTYGSRTISYAVFVLSNILLFELSLTNKKSNLLLFSLSVGLGSTIHSIIFILFPAQMLIFFLLNKENFLKRIFNILLISFLVFIFGASNYFFEIFYGDGWIFGTNFNFINKIMSIINYLSKML